MKIVGIDPSLTRTGVAVIDSSDRSVKTHSIVSKAPPPLPKGRKHPIVDRRKRLEGIHNRVFEIAYESDLVVIEGPSLASNNPGTFERYGLWWLIVDWFITTGIPVAICTPATRAKWATGNGGAGKDEVMLAIDRLWRGVANNNDEADALAFATMGAQWIGLPVPSLARHAESIAAVQWPDGGTADRLRASVELIPGRSGLSGRPEAVRPSTATLGGIPAVSR